MVDHAGLLADGIHAARLGDKRTARRLLTEAVHHDPSSVTAWLWLSGVMDTPQGRTHCLHQVLAVDPENQMAQRGLAALQATGPAPVIVARSAPVRPAPPGAPASASAETASSPARPFALHGELQRPRPEASLPTVGLRESVRAALSTRLSFLRHVAGPPKETAQPAPSAARPTGVPSQPRAWRIVVASLAIVSLALIALLVYAQLSAGEPRRAALLPAAPQAMIAGPRSRPTLRPTFTPEPAQPTDRPVVFAPGPVLATFTPTPTPPSYPFDELPPMLATFTPTPLESATPLQRAARPRATSAVPPPTVLAHAPLPPRAWDPRLTPLNVRFEPAPAAPGQGYWRLVEARWADGVESEGRHAIYVEVLNAQGGRAVGQPVIFEWSTGSETLPVQNPPAPDWPLNFPMYNTLGSYSARVGGGPSDKVIGMGMGTAEQRHFTIHTSFYLTFRWVVP